MAERRWQKSVWSRPYKKYQIGTAGGWLDPSDPTVSESKLGSGSKTRPRPPLPCPYTLLPALYRKPRPYFFVVSLVAVFFCKLWLLIFLFLQFYP